MTISIKPTASGSTIEQDGSTVLSVESDRSVDIDSGTLHVDATNNRVGVGTSSPSAQLHIIGANGTTSLSSYDAQTGLILENNNDSQFSIIANSANSSQLFFGDQDNELIGRIRYNHSGNDMQFYTNSAERMRIDSSGRVTMPYQPYFNATRSSNLTVDPSNQTQIIVFDSTSKNVGNHYSTSTGLFTAPVSGIYAFTSGVYGFTFDQLWAVINGTRNTSFYLGTTTNNAGSFTKYLNANDTLGIHAFSGASSGTILASTVHTYFEGGLIG